MGFVSGKNKKSLDVELNLLPIFDVLSVCICFLLMTVVWISVGSVNTSQALGGQSQAETKSPPSVWLTVDEKSNVTFSFKHTKNKMGDQVVNSNNGQLNFDQLKNRINSLAQANQFEIALLMPARNTSYNSIINIMDSLKAANVKDVGLSPL